MPARPRSASSPVAASGRYQAPSPCDGDKEKYPSGFGAGDTEGREIFKTLILLTSIRSLQRIEREILTEAYATAQDQKRLSSRTSAKREDPGPTPERRASGGPGSPLRCGRDDKALLVVEDTFSPKGAILKSHGETIAGLERSLR